MGKDGLGHRLPLWLGDMRIRIGAVLILATALLAGSLRADWNVKSTKSRQGPGVLFVEKQIGNDGRSELHTIRLILLDSKQCTLRVVDNPEGKLSLGSAMEQAGCVAGVNGGYFRADFTPVGLEIGNERRIHPMQGGKLITGLVVVNRGRVALLRTGEFKWSPSITEALQSGPFLIDHGRPVAGLNSTKEADRTVVLSDGKGGCALLMAESVTLAEMAQILAKPAIIPELKIVRALNLDGGSSSGIWMREPPVYVRELKRVRSFLGVIARK